MKSPWETSRDLKRKTRRGRRAFGTGLSSTVVPKTPESRERGVESLLLPEENPRRGPHDPTF